MGSYDAVELFGSERRTVVRATHGPAGDVYAVSYRVDGTPIDEHSYNLFDLTCRSIRYDGN